MEEEKEETEEEGVKWEEKGKEYVVTSYIPQILIIIETNMMKLRRYRSEETEMGWLGG